MLSWNCYLSDFDASGDPKLVDDGLKAMTQMLYDWHQNGTMSKDLWGSVSGTKYHAPNDWWNAAEVVFMMSGSWQIGRFANEVGDDFDWWAVPAPCGPAACTGMPGGNALLAFTANDAVGRVMDYLSSKEIVKISTRILHIFLKIIFFKI